MSNYLNKFILEQVKNKESDIVENDHLENSESKILLINAVVLQNKGIYPLRNYNSSSHFTSLVPIIVISLVLICYIFMFRIRKRKINIFKSINNIA